MPASAARGPPWWNPHHVDVCTPAQVEAPTGRGAFGGYHWIEPLKAWLYEIPKSGSSTLMQLFRAQAGRDDRGRRDPEPDDIAFAVVRDPLCRAISGFREAWARAAFRKLVLFDQTVDPTSRRKRWLVWPPQSMRSSDYDPSSNGKMRHVDLHADDLPRVLDVSLDHDVWAHVKLLRGRCVRLR